MANLLRNSRVFTQIRDPRPIPARRSGSTRTAIHVPAPRRSHHGQGPAARQGSRIRPLAADWNDCALDRGRSSAATTKSNQSISRPSNLVIERIPNIIFRFIAKTYLRNDRNAWRFAAVVAGKKDNGSYRMDAGRVQGVSWNVA